MKLNFIGIGPQKNGSTWLDEIFRAHPDTYVPSATKETWYLDQYYKESLDGYIDYFAEADPNQLIGEVCPTYFDSVEVISRIKKHFGEIKILVNLRNPVSKAESLFRHHLRKGRVTNDFSAASDKIPRIIESGRYAKFLPMWIEAFGKDNVHVILLDDIASKPEVVYNELCEFLSISSDYTPTSLGEQVNKAGMPKFPLVAKFTAKLVTIVKRYKFHKIISFGKKMGLKKVYDGGGELPGLSVSQKKELLKEYEEDIAYVEKLIEKKLDHWRV